MRVAALLVVAMFIVSGAAAQDQAEKDDPSRSEVRVTGCVKGSTLVESNLRMQSAGADSMPERRWRLRGPKALMNDLKKQAGKELVVVGTTKNPSSGTVVGSKRIGKTNIYIGTNADASRREPLPELPTIDVASFEPTGETCR